MRSALQFVFYPFIILSTALVVLLRISQSPFLFERLISWAFWLGVGRRPNDNF